MLFYFFIIFISCFMLFLLQKTTYTLQNNNSTQIHRKYFNKRHIFVFYFAALPIILTFTLRYGIGADYFAYKTIFELLHKADFNKYFTYHNLNIGSYYVEVGYYFFNRFFCFDFPSLLCVCSLVILGFIYYGSISITSKVNFAWCIFIYYCTQFIFSINVMRFAISITIIYFGIKFILNRNFIKWIVCVLLATSFHKTSIICMPLYLLANVDNKRLSKFRNGIWYLFVLGFPVIAKLLFQVAGNVPMFSRYFKTAKYMLNDFSFKPMFLFHIAPVLLPLLIVKRKFLLGDKRASLLFRISLFEIPMRELGAFSTWLSRLARFPQMVQLILIPYVVGEIKNPKLKIFIKFYYIAWYIFYFMYGALVNDQGDSIPYISIFSNGGTW